MADEKLVDARHRGFRRGIVAHTFRPGYSCAEAVRFEERLNELKSPFERADYSVFIACGEPGFPVVHPARVFFLEHVVSSSLPAPALPLYGIDHQPDEAHQCNQGDVGERDDAVKAPDAEDVTLDVGQVKGKDE